MKPYPSTQAEYEARFSTEAACQDYLSGVRWPQGFRCPGCGGAGGWHSVRDLWICSACRRQVSGTAGTIFHRSHQPLRQWFRAIWWVTSQKGGVSALGLQRVLGLGSYRTAWLMVHKLRRAMVRPGRDRLSGRVEVDEAYVGGFHPGKRGRGAAGKALVLVAAEARGRGVGRTRLARVPDGSAPRLEAFVHAAVEPGGTVITDGNAAYGGLKALGYRHQVTLMQEAEGRESRMLPRVHQVISLLKRWLMGTHQGAVSPAHLSEYLDEFTFRFNRRTSRSRGQLFLRLIEYAVQVAPTPYRGLVRHVRGRRPRRPKI